MKPTRVLAVATAGALLAAAPAAANPLTDPVQAGSFALDRALVLSTPSLSASTVIREGGLSALQVAAGTGNRRFLSVSDRGPNGQPNAAVGGRTFPALAFSPIVYELQADDDGRLSVLSRTQLKVPGTDPLRADPLIGGDPQLITGLRNVTTAGLDDRIYRMMDDTTLAEYTPTDPYGMDTEGIARDPRDGSLWISDEYRPSIARFTPGGVMRSRVVPAGNGALPTSQGGTLADAYGGANPSLQELLPQEYAARRQNRGMEGLAISADGTKLYGMLQNPLDTRGYPNQGYGTTCLGTSDIGPGAVSPNSTNYWRDIRIVEFDITTPASPVLTGEWVYRLESLSTTDSTLQGKLRVSDIAWQGSRKLIVDEHDDDNTLRNGRKLWEVDLNGATNLRTASGLTSYADRQTSTTIGTKSQAKGCFLDNGSSAELTALGVTPATKQQYLNIGAGPTLFNYNKVEGIALLEGQPGIALVNDNDFSLDQNVNTNAITDPGTPSELRFYAERPSSTPPTVTGTPTAGRTLTCAPGTYGGVGTLSATYVWSRNGTPVAGADGSRFTLSGEDVGASITCTVAATRVAGAVRAPASLQTSAPTAAVADFPPGATGDTGSTGGTGPGGPRGGTGDTGPAGTGGPRGATGDVGPRGDLGPAGRDGAGGAIGPQGPAGPLGPQGLPGAAGPKGATGATGPLGKITCKVKRKRGRVRSVRCTVVAAAGTRRVLARHAGRTVAQARVHAGRAVLVLPAGTRRASLVAVDARGHRTRAGHTTLA